MRDAALLVVALSTVGVGCARGGGPGGPMGSDVRTDETAIERVLLENGLVVITKEVTRAPLVAVQAWVQAGSAGEGSRLGSGISHFVEHMLFKGTATRGVGEVHREIKSYGGGINAFTSHDHTAYQLVTPRAYAAQAIAVLADALQHSSFDPVEVEKERAVILNEIRMDRDSPLHRLHRLFWRHAFLEHPYRHPVIGYADLLQTLTRADLVAYHAERYVPNNMVVTVVGDLPTAVAQELVRAAFGDAPRRALAPTVVRPEPLHMSGRQVSEPFPAAHAYFALGFPSVALSHPDLYALDVLALILGQGDSSRLAARVQRQQRLVHSIEAANYTPKDPGVFEITGMCDEAQVEPALAAVRAELEAVRTQRIGPEELAKAKRVVEAWFVSKQQTVEDQAAELASNEILTGDPVFHHAYVRGVRAVTPEDVQRVAHAYLVEARATQATLVPERAGVEAAAPAMARPAPPVVKRTLRNGLRVLVREDHSVPLVVLRATFLGGVQLEDERSNGISRLTSRMLTAGTVGRSKDALAAEVEALGATLEPFSGNNSFGVTLHALSGDLAHGVELLCDVVTESTFPAGEVDRERALALAAVEARDDDIFGVASRLVRSALYTVHPFRLDPVGSRESVGALQREDVLAFYRARRDASQMMVAAFGDLEEGAVLPALERRLGGLPLGAGTWPAARPEPGTAGRSQSQQMPREQAVVMLGFRTVPAPSQDRYALEILADVLSGGGGRLFTRVREDAGKAYNVGAYTVLGRDTGFCVLYAATAPGQEDDVRARLVEVVTQLGEEGLSAQELTDAQRGIIGREQLALETNAALSLQASLDELLGIGYDAYAAYATRIEQVTAEDVRRVVRTYFQPTAAADVRVGPAAPALEPAAAP